MFEFDEARSRRAAALRIVAAPAARLIRGSTHWDSEYDLYILHSGAIAVRT